MTRRTVSLALAIFVLCAAGCASAGGNAGGDSQTDGATGSVSPPSAPLASATAAARFLEQATFGPTSQLIAQVQQVGLSSFLQSQFDAPSSTFDDAQPDAQNNFNDASTLQRRWFTNALYGPDQLRQRVAFALHKIWVVSWVTVNDSRAFVSYLRMHQDHAFGNYRQIMENVTLNAAMGTYQDIANNDEADPARGLNCNENYGRELMQLFTIGVWKMNQDGTFQRDAQGNLIPTYDQPVVEGNACALTGWTYAKATPSTANWPRPAFYSGPLEPVDSHHDTNPKLLLDGFVVPAGGTAAQDLRLTLDNLFQHPNVPPWVSRLLIQQLVSSNPSPAYVERVANAFSSGRSGSFGNGQRGDLKAVIAAILLDAEARRGDTLLPDDPGVKDDGKLKEPVLFILNLLRATGASSDGSFPISRATNMGQRYLFSPTVFSYFAPDYQIPGSPLFSPELQIHTTSTVFERANFVNSYVFGSPSGTTVDLTPFANLAANPSQLLDSLNVLMLRGKMTSAMRESILNAVSGSNQNLTRARTAIYLIATSSQYQVQQ